MYTKEINSEAMADMESSWLPDGKSGVACDGDKFSSSIECLKSHSICYPYIGDFKSVTWIWHKCPLERAFEFRGTKGSFKLKSLRIPPHHNLG